MAVTPLSFGILLLIGRTNEENANSELCTFGGVTNQEGATPGRSDSQSGGRRHTLRVPEHSNPWNGLSTHFSNPRIVQSLKRPTLEEKCLLPIGYKIVIPDANLYHNLSGGLVVQSEVSQARSHPGYPQQRWVNADANSAYVMVQYLHIHGDLRVKGADLLSSGVQVGTYCAEGT